MKYIYTFFSVLLAATLLLTLNSNSAGPGQTSNAARTGAPSEGNCTSCHASSTANYSSAAMSVQVRDALNNVVTSYTPGQTYTIAMQMSGVVQPNVFINPQFGGQLTALKSSNNTTAGTLSAPSTGARVKAIGTKSYLEHTQRSATGLWTASWTAPTSGTGSVNLYAYGLAVTNGSTSGDLGAGTTVTLSEAITSNCNITVTRTVTNATCFGVCNGSISVAATGGTAPYVFRMLNNTASPNNVFTNLCAGGYAITATDANGCSAIITASVTQPTAVTVSTSSTAAVGTQANGSATASASGGTAPYSYVWGTSASGATRTGLVAGTYIVTVFDANQCSATASVVVSATQPPCNITVTRTVTNATCFGVCNGSISVAATGGTAPYVFRMLNNTASPNNVFTNLCAGGYAITATDANGCSAIITATVTQPTAITVSTSSTAAVGTQANGSATASASGGTAPYSYVWGTSASGATRTGLVAGTYIVTVFDANQCSATASVVVSATQAPCNISVTRTIINASCFGSCNGSIAVAATGGTAPCTFRMGTSAPNPNNVFTNLCAGGYAITATDANGCSAIITASVTQPTAITVSTSSTAAVGTQANGSATASASGGTAPYTYAWGTSASGATRTGLAAGTYIVTVFDANQCSATASVVVSATQAPCNISVTRTIINASCFGSCNGSISVAATGGTAPYVFRMLNNTASPNNVFTNLCAGGYAITATDANGCSAIITASVTQPTAITVSTSSTAAVGTQANGSATASASGGTAPYSYVWGTSASGATRTGLAAGTYIVTVFDANQCSATASVVVSATQPPCNVSVTRTVINASCFGACNGSISVAATGGTAPYIFRMLNNTASPNNVFTNLCAGGYAITATDANGCSAIITASVTQPTAITVSTSSTAAVGTQANGSATASASGGTAPYSYVWGTSASGATRTGLVAGTYIVTVFDANQCSATASVVVSATQPPCNITVTRTVTNATCFGVCNGSISVAATGGTAPYVFRVLNNTASPNNVFTNLCAGGYAITATDANGCSAIITVSVTQPTAITVNTSSTAAVGTQANGSATASASGGTAPYSYSWGAGSSGATRTGLVAGTYIVTVFDANQCSATASVVVSATQAPCNISVSITVTNVNCFGDCNGSISVAATGGTAPYIFRMLNNTANPNNVFTNLCAGSYTITATDANGCTAIVTASVTQPTAITVNVSTNNATNSQSNGSALANASGGTPSYFYSWSNGAFNSAATGLAAGVYTVTVFDARQCQATASAVVSATQAVCNVSVTRTVTNVNCFGACNGSISVAATGGRSPYIFRMGTSVANANNVFTNLCAGSYSITATDANGCTAIVTATVTQPTAITVSTSSTAAVGTQANGSATASASGGTAPYSYSWGAGSSGATRTGLAAGTYIVTVFDANQCSATASVVVSATQAPCNISVTRTVINASCFGICNGSISVAATGGTAPYVFRMLNNTASPNNVFTNLCAGNYTITATDANGCSAIITASVTQPTAVNITVTSSGEINCNNTSVTLTATGASTYSWNSSNASNTLAVTAPGVYSVIGTSQNGCTGSGTVTVTSNRTLPPAFQATSNQAYTNSNFPATITIANFNPNLYTYRLVDFATGVVVATFTSGSMTNATGGTFRIQCISNANGCSSFSNRIKIIFDPNYGLISNTSGGGIVNRQSNSSNSTTRLMEGEILVFPSPANDFLKISYDFALETEATFSIYSTDGRLVWEQKTNGTSDQLQVDASTFVNGQYFLRVVSKDFSEVKTIQILR